MCISARDLHFTAVLCVCAKSGIFLPLFPLLVSHSLKSALDKLEHLEPQCQEYEQNISEAESTIEELSDAVRLLEQERQQIQAVSSCIRSMPCAQFFTQEETPRLTRLSYHETTLAGSLDRRHEKYYADIKEAFIP